jgi:hypothetical protein
MGEPGLCLTCQHVKRTETKRGSVFYLCLLSQSDARLRKYPPLPVLRCHGYRPRQSRDDERQDMAMEDTGHEFT